MAKRSGLARVVLRPAPVGALVVVACACVLSMVGSSSPGASAATVLTILGEALPLAVCWVASGWGLGLVVGALLGMRGAPGAVSPLVGCAVLFWIDHVLGMSGVLSPAASWAMLAPGWVALVWGVRRGPLQAKDGARGSAWWWLLGVPAAGLLVVAACLPPGAIWASEAHGYDTLSYHLQLPKEWLAQGRVWPVEHNVYSFLPSFMEAAFARLGAMTGIGAGAEAPLGAGAGTAVHAAQLLHACFAVVAAWAVAGVVRQVGGERADRFGAAVGGAILLGVPWVSVTGSMAYNEMAVCAMLAGAIGAAMHPGAKAWQRGVAVGVLIGAACSLKPTAMFMAMPVAAVAMAAGVERKRWIGAFAAAGVAGVVMIAPWMVRNWMASGNPVFPSAPGLFGLGHWTEAQHARWGGAHHLDLSMAERLGRLVSERFGLMHPQWSVVALFAGAAAIVCMAVRDARRKTWPLVVGVVVQCIAWMWIGHLQSRFLVPAVVPMAILCGAAVGVVRARSARLGTAVGVAAALVLSGDAIRLFLQENGGAPSRAMVAGVEVFNASGYASPGPPEMSRENYEFYLRAGPTALVNQVMVRSVPEPRILLMGDATPLYFADAGERIVYATTWDASPVTRALDACGADPACLVERLRAEGFTHVLINAAELDRLRDSGYSDPRVTPELGLMIARRSRSVMPWPDRGQILVELVAPDVDSPPR